MNLDCDDNPDDEPPDDLVQGVLGYGSPAGIGGVEKSLKSSILTELAVCISASEPVKFLNYFPVCEQSLDVTYLNYEGTTSEFQDRTRRIEKARGVRANREYLHVLQGFPPLNDDDGLDKLDRFLSVSNSTIVIVDALYGDLRGSDFSRLSEIGGHLSSIFEVCRNNDSTPISVHHFGKGGAKDGLQSFSGTGVAQHVGQWVLLHKAGRYDPDTGHSRLRLEIGSRAGFGGRYTLDITEGRLSNPGGRRWETTVESYSAKPAKENAEDDNRREAKGTGKLAEEVLAYIAENPDSTVRAIRAGFGDRKSHRSISQAVESLMADGKVVEAEVTVRGNRTSGYRIQDVGSTRDLSHVESHRGKWQGEKTIIVGLWGTWDRGTPFPLFERGNLPRHHVPRPTGRKAKAKKPTRDCPTSPTGQR